MCRKWLQYRVCTVMGNQYQEFFIKCTWIFNKSIVFDMNPKLTNECALQNTTCTRRFKQIKDCCIKSKKYA